MKQKRLFNPTGDDSLEARRLIEGNSTNIFNLNNVRYKWANSMYRKMMENFWIPEKVDLSSDNLDSLTNEELQAYTGILSFLIFLDSEQTNNLPNISSYITAPEVTLCLAVQTYQEAVHSQSYQYIVESVIPLDKRNEVYEYWRNDKVLFDRISYIASIYQDFVDEPTLETFYKTIIANYLLEGLYFYNGFTFFYNLASRGKMIGSSEVIRYINRDELTHVILFQNIIKELGIKDKYIVYEMVERAVEQEIAWTNHIIGNNILGQTTVTTEEYTKHLANRRLKNINYDPIYENTHNPYKHLEAIADTVGSSTVKSNQFESTITSYNQSTAIGGWDKF